MQITSYNHSQLFTRDSQLCNYSPTSTTTSNHHQSHYCHCSGRGSWSHGQVTQLRRNARRSPVKLGVVGWWVSWLVLSAVHFCVPSLASLFHFCLCVGLFHWFVSLLLCLFRVRHGFGCCWSMLLFVVIGGNGGSGGCLLVFMVEFGLGSVLLVVVDHGRV